MPLERGASQVLMGDQVLTEQLVSQVVMDHLEYQAGQAFQVLVGDQGTLVLLVQVVYLADQGEEEFPALMD